MAVPTLTIGVTDVTSKVHNNTFSYRLNSLDVTLMDPTAVPALDDAVTVDDPAWSGTVASVTVEDNNRAGHKWVKITATNTDEAVANPAPFDLVDTDGDFRNLVVTTSKHDTTTETRGSLETFLPGLSPGDVVQITSATQGWTAEEFSITDISVSWLASSTPLFKIDFGDAIVTLSAWVNEDSGVLPITSTKITDGAVTTPKLNANAVTADKLAAILVLASTLKTAETGYRVEISSDGVFLYDDSDQMVVKIPTDGDPVYVSGELNASSLVSENTAEFRTEATLAKGAVMTVDAKIEAPTTAPVLAKGYQNVALDTSGGYAADGVSWGIDYESSHYYVATGSGGSEYIKFWKFDTSGTYVSVATTTSSTGVEIINGFCLNATHYFLYLTDGNIRKFLRSDNSLVSTTDFTSSVTDTVKASIFYDGTAGSIVLVTTTGTGTGKQFRFRLINPTTMAVSSTLDATGFSINGSNYAFAGGALEGGKYWINVYSDSVGTYSKLVLPFNASTGAYVSDGIWGYTSAGVAGAMTGGICHNGSVFVGKEESAENLLVTTDWDWTTESSKYWVGYSWYDSDGTTHETTLGPRASITMYRRMRIQITVAAIPDAGDADDPNNVRIYLARNATEPAITNYKLQATTSDTLTTLTDFNASGSADPSSNDFPSASPAEMKSSTAGWSLKGDGSATFDDVSMTGLITSYNGNTIQSYAPTITNGGTATYTTREGYYQKIGNIVFVVITLQINSAGSGGGEIEIALPSTASSDSRFALFGRALGFTTYNDGVVMGYVAAGGTTLSPIEDYDGTNLTRSHFASSALLVLSGWYYE